MQLSRGVRYIRRFDWFSFYVLVITQLLLPYLCPSAHPFLKGLPYNCFKALLKALTSHHRVTAIYCGSVNDDGEPFSHQHHTHFNILSFSRVFQIAVMDMRRWFDRVKEKVGTMTPSTDASATSSSNQTPNNSFFYEKENIFRFVKQAMKGLQQVSLTSSRTISSNPVATQLCSAIELALTHGLKVPWHLRDATFWRIAVKLSHKNVIQAIKR
eukprot:gene6875-9529_t